jgi:C4-dicarboxylate transporter DctQ subunit
LKALTAAAGRASAALGRFIDGFGILMLAISAGITFVAVVMRYGFGKSDQLAEEIARYTIVYACLMYVGPLQMRGQHIAVDVISSRFPPPAKRAWQFAIGVLFLAIVSCVFAAGWIWVADLRQSGMTVIGGTMPAWVPSLSVPLGMGLAVLFGLSEVLRLGLALLQPPPEPAAQAAAALDVVN